MIEFRIHINQKISHYWHIILRLVMFGLSCSQSTAAIVMLASIVLYFAANTTLKQNAFIFLFAVTLTIIIVGTVLLTQISCS